MTALPKQQQRYTLEEYLELDRTSEERYEYFDGEIFAMTGGSLNHNLIVGNLLARLHQQLWQSDCKVLPSDMRIKVPTALPYRYPDLSIFCGEPRIENLSGQQLLVNPLVLIEVLSPSTEAYDLGRKFTAYQSIESFREYLLVAQDRVHVTHYVKQAGGGWLRFELEGLGSMLTLQTVNCTMALRDIYRAVNFDLEPSS